MWWKRPLWVLGMTVLGATTCEAADRSGWFVTLGGGVVQVHDRAYQVSYEGLDQISASPDQKDGTGGWLGIGLRPHDYLSVAAIASYAHFPALPSWTDSYASQRFDPSYRMGVDFEIHLQPPVRVGIAPFLLMEAGASLSHQGGSRYTSNYPGSPPATYIAYGHDDLAPSSSVGIGLAVLPGRSLFTVELSARRISSFSNENPPDLTALRVQVTRSVGLRAPGHRASSPSSSI